MPKLPNNLTYWKSVLCNPKYREQFNQRGDARQKREMLEALNYLKWQKIQLNKGE